jgi:metallophosphoesterase superfamily enzyme
MTLTALEHAAVQERRAKSETWQSIAVALGKNESALRRAVKRFDARHAAMPETQDAPPETVRSAPGLTEGLNAEAPAFESDDAPPPAVRHPAVGPRESARAQRLVTRLDGLEKILVIPDTHVPFEDELAFAVLLAAGRFLKPDTIVFLGDFADFMSVSFHPRELGRRGYTLKEEAEAVNARLDQIQALGAKRVVFIKGNHEYRLERYLTEKAPSLFGLVDVAALFRFEERGWECVEYRKHLKIGRMHFTHDVGHAGIYAHRQSRMAYEGNVVIGHCLPIDYEVLTSTRGFVKLSDVTTNDRALSYKDGRVVEGPISEVVRWKYSGEVAKFDSYAISQTMTDRHHIFTRDGRYMPVREAVKALTKADLVLKAAPLDQPEYPVSDDMLRFVVAYCADGSRASEGSIRFHLKKTRKVARLTEILIRLGSPVVWAPPGKTGSVKTKGLGRQVQLEVIRLAPNKRLPDWMLNLSARQRQIVIDELVEWDGSSIRQEGHDYGSRQFCSVKQAERDLVQMLLAQHGIRSSVGARPVVSYNVFEKQADAVTKLSASMSWEHVDDLDVGCISTSFNNFWIRTPEGRIELTGNTHRIGYEIAGTSKGPSHAGIALGWLGDKGAIDYMHAAKAAQWALGFGVAYHERASGNVHVVPVPIVDYRCVVEGQLIEPLKGTSVERRVA